VDKGCNFEQSGAKQAADETSEGSQQADLEGAFQSGTGRSGR